MKHQEKTEQLYLYITQLFLANKELQVISNKIVGPRGFMYFRVPIEQNLMDRSESERNVSVEANETDEIYGNLCQLGV